MMKLEMAVGPKSPYIKREARARVGHSARQIPRERRRLWSECLTGVAKPLLKRIDYSLIESLSVLTAELIQDHFSDLDIAEQHKHLQRALQFVEMALKSPPSNETFSELLARKSSLLRCRAILTVSPNQKRATLEEGLRAARKAMELHRSGNAAFELALSNWAMARSANSDEEYVDRLTEAESLLKSEAVKQIEVARLTLPRFYRLTYRPTDACEEFAKLESGIRHLRRFLASVYVYAESVVLLWFQNYPTDYVNTHRLNALNLSERAIDAGFGDARNFLNVAYLRAIGGDVRAGEIAIRSLSTRRDPAFWEAVLSLVSDSRPADAATESFVLGIADSQILTRLGTFVLRFMDDIQLAGRLYEVALQVDSKNPVALTNLARFRLNHDPETSHQEIERLLHKAETYSDRRFRWWRVVLEELSAKKEKEPPTIATVDDIPALNKAPANIREVRARFKRVSRLADPQKRGYELEKLVFHLARLNLGFAKPSYRFSRGPQSMSQIDCYFEYRGDRYRVECKWKHEPLDVTHFATFRESLDVFGVAGILISMSGFDVATIERAHEHRKEKAILLVDGDEMIMVFDGRLNFDHLLRVKRLHYDQYSETYYRINDSTDTTRNAP